MSMLSEANLPQSFWMYMLSTYRHIYNRCPTSTLLHNLTPFKVYKDCKPCIGHLCVFGCATYVLMSRDKRKRLQRHCVSGIFIGYPDNHVSWKVYIPKTREILVSRDVVFDKTCLPGLLATNAPPPPPLKVFDNLPDLNPNSNLDATVVESMMKEKVKEDPFNIDELLTSLSNNDEDSESMVEARPESQAQPGGLVGAEPEPESQAQLGGLVEAESKPETQPEPQAHAPCQPRPLPPLHEPSQQT